MYYKDEEEGDLKEVKKPQMEDDVIETCHQFIEEYEKPNYLEAGYILKEIFNNLMTSKEYSSTVYEAIANILMQAIVDNVNTSITIDAMHTLAILITDTHQVTDEIRTTIDVIKDFHIQSTNTDMREKSWILFAAILITSQDNLEEFVKNDGIPFILDSFCAQENQNSKNELIKIIYATCKMFSEYENQRENTEEEDEEESLPEINDDLLLQLNDVTSLVVHLLLNTSFWKRAALCLSFLLDIKPIIHYIYYESHIIREIRHGFIAITKSFSENKDFYYDIDHCSRLIAIEDSITNLLAHAHKTTPMTKWPLEPMVDLVFGESSAVSCSALRFLDLYVKQYQSSGISYISRCGAISKLGDEYDELPSEVKKESMKLFCSMILESEGNQITAVTFLLFDKIMDYLCDSSEEETILITKVIVFLMTNNRHDFVNERKEDIISFIDEHDNYPDELDFVIQQLEDLYSVKEEEDFVE